MDTGTSKYDGAPAKGSAGSAGPVTDAARENPEGNQGDLPHVTMDTGYEKTGAR